MVYVILRSQAIRVDHHAVARHFPLDTQVRHMKVQPIGATRLLHGPDRPQTTRARHKSHQQYGGTEACSIDIQESLPREVYIQRDTRVDAFFTLTNYRAASFCTAPCFLFTDATGSFSEPMFKVGITPF
ncbi:hypothetical protein Ac2012v2_005537 [Leucoagaricus gongylophorus]